MLARTHLALTASPQPHAPFAAVASAATSWASAARALKHVLTGVWVHMVSHEKASMSVWSECALTVCIHTLTILTQPRLNCEV